MWGPKAAFPTRMNSGVEKMYKNNIAIAIGTLTMAVEFSMVSANAEPAPPPGQDPHMPNSAMGYCPGGGFGGITGWGYCDGIRYPDGSYWHQVRVPAPFVGTTLTLSCVIDDGSPVPPLAAPGSCGGAHECELKNIARTDATIGKYRDGGFLGAPERGWHLLIFAIRGVVVTVGFLLPWWQWRWAGRCAASLSQGSTNMLDRRAIRVGLPEHWNCALC